MSNSKYRLNPHTLSFEKIEQPLGKKILRSFLYLLASLIVAIIINFTYSSFFDTPKAKVLGRDNTELQLKYELFGKKLAEIDQLLTDIQTRDNQIYRSIFEADTIPSTVLQGGIGGVDQFQHFQGHPNADLLIETSTMLNRITWRTYLQSKSFDDVIDLARNKEQMITSIPAIQPISVRDLTRISSFYGHRTDPFTRIRTMHPGVDFVGPIGSPVHATGNGTVISAHKSFFGYGKMIIIDHGFGYRTRYAHLNELLVKSGEKVTRGQVIATLGNSGRSTGPHLHYEVLHRNRTVNPLNYFSDISEDEYEQMVLNAALERELMETMD